jgi:hypothetical protein
VQDQEKTKKKEKETAAVENLTKDEAKRIILSKEFSKFFDESTRLVERALN